MSLGWGPQFLLTRKECGSVSTGAMNVAAVCRRLTRLAVVPGAARRIRSSLTETKSFGYPHRREPFAYHIYFLRSALARGPPEAPQDRFSQKDLRFL